jgi:hypothetical protein
MKNHFIVKWYSRMSQRGTIRRIFAVDVIIAGGNIAIAAAPVRKPTFILSLMLC